MWSVLRHTKKAWLWQGLCKRAMRCEPFVHHNKKISSFHSLCRGYGDPVTKTFTTQHDCPSGPSPTGYRFCGHGSLLEEKEFHKLADELLHYIQEKIEEFGEECDIDGFDIDHAEGVLTIKLGANGTYVVNKQTPNRQIWLSSPVSGPARFDWNAEDHCWVYKRTRSEILDLLEKEMNKLLGGSFKLSK